MESPRQPRSEIAPDTLVVASVGSAAATVVIGRFGLAGTLLGAALFPVVLALAKELARRPTRRLPHSLRRSGGPASGPEPRARLGELRWQRVAATAAAAFALVVGAFTLTELVSGTSLVSDRPTTFFSPGGEQPPPAPPPGEPGMPAPDDPPADEEEPPPEVPDQPPAEEPPPDPVPEEPPAEELP